MLETAIGDVQRFQTAEFLEGKDDIWWQTLIKVVPKHD